MGPAQRIHAWEQLGAHLRELGRAVAQYRAGLVEGGMNEAEASEWAAYLRDEWIRELLTRPEGLATLK